MASEPRSGSQGNSRRNDFTMEFTSDQLEVLETKSENSSVATDSKTCDDIYAILDDKNRAIEILKRRLANQKLQLGYYLHKNFTNDQVREFSAQCFPHLAENNTQISLAMYKFLKDTGGKTRLAQLREKLQDSSIRVHKALLRQEQLMRGGLSLELMPADGESQEDCFTVKCGDEMRFAKKALGVAQLEISSRLLSVTLNVHEEMEKFRLCAESIVNLEKDRNLLVDKVFSLPVEERYDMHLASLDLDAHQKRQEVVAEEATRAASTISISTNTTDADFNNEGNRNLGGVLRDMESEALQLLMMSEKQKNDFVMALEDARMENQHLKERLKDIEEATSDEQVMKLQEKCLNIEAEVEEMRNTFEIEQSEKELTLQNLAIELCNKEASEQRLQQEVKNITAALAVLREERNELQKKCEEEQMKNCFAQQNTSTDMLSHSEVQTQEMNELADLVVIQEEQIKDLLSIMSELQISIPVRSNSNHNLTNSSSIQTKNMEEIINTVDEKEQEQQTNEILSSSANKIEEDFFDNVNIDSLDSGMFAPLKPITPPVFDDFENNEVCDSNNNKTIENNDNLETHDSDEDVCHIFFDSSSETSNMQDDESSPLVTETLKTEGNITTARFSTPSTEKNNMSKENRSDKSLRSSRSASRKVFGNKKPIQILKQKSSGLAVTSLRVEAFDADGKSESMHAVLESSSPVDGLLELNNSSKLHLRLQCTSPQRNEYSLMTINEDGVDETSCMYCPEENVSGDHIRNHTPRSIVGNKTAKHQQPTPNSHNINKTTKLFLTKQLKKLKKQLRNVSSSQGKAEVFHNFKEVYSNLFGGDSEHFTEGFS